MSGFTCLAFCCLTLSVVFCAAQDTRSSKSKSVSSTRAKSASAAPASLSRHPGGGLQGFTHIGSDTLGGGHPSIPEILNPRPFPGGHPSGPETLHPRPFPPQHGDGECPRFAQRPPRGCSWCWNDRQCGRNEKCCRVQGCQYRSCFALLVHHEDEPQCPRRRPCKSHLHQYHRCRPGSCHSGNVCCRDECGYRDCFPPNRRNRCPVHIPRRRQGFHCTSQQDPVCFGDHDNFSCRRYGAEYSCCYTECGYRCTNTLHSGPTRCADGSRTVAAVPSRSCSRNTDCAHHDHCCSNNNRCAVPPTGPHCNGQRDHTDVSNGQAACGDNHDCRRHGRSSCCHFGHCVLPPQQRCLGRARRPYQYCQHDSHCNRWECCDRGICLQRLHRSGLQDTHLQHTSTSTQQ